MPSNQVRKRLFITLLVGLFLFAGLLARLGYVQLVEGNWLNDKARDLWTRDIPFEGKRGRILDRKGEVLAYNISSPSVLAIPAQIEDPAKTARELAHILMAPEQNIYRQITKKQLIVRLQPYGRKISNERAQSILERRLP